MLNKKQVFFFKRFIIKIKKLKTFKFQLMKNSLFLDCQLILQIWKEQTEFTSDALNITSIGSNTTSLVMKNAVVISIDLNGVNQIDGFCIESKAASC